MIVKRLHGWILTVISIHITGLEWQLRSIFSSWEYRMVRIYLENMVPSDVSNAVRKTLADLHERGYKIALGSSSRNAKIILKKVALEEAFDAISDGTNISKSKPDPEVFLKAAEYLDLQPEECIVVEDAYAGIDAAKAGNMQAVGTGEAYSYAKADYHIKKIEELLTILP